MSYYKFHYGEDFKIKTDKLYGLTNHQEILNQIWFEGYEDVKLYKYTKQPNMVYIGELIMIY